MTRPGPRSAEKDVGRAAEAAKDGLKDAARCALVNGIGGIREYHANALADAIIYYVETRLASRRVGGRKRG